MVAREKIEQKDISICLKYGIHSVFLFVDPSAPFSQAADELVEILRERFPEGLSSRSTEEIAEIPLNSAQITFGLLANPHDPTQGWKAFMLEPKDTAASLGIKDNSIVAFALPDGDGEEAGLLVDWADFDDDAMEVN